MLFVCHPVFFLHVHLLNCYLLSIETCTITLEPSGAMLPEELPIRKHKRPMQLDLGEFGSTRKRPPSSPYHGGGGAPAKAGIPQSLAYQPPHYSSQGRSEFVWMCISIVLMV